MSHFITGSGYLNNPVRTLLIADDNRPGSYPVEISPIVAAKSSQYTRPYRDNVMPDTPVVYGQAKVTFTDIPTDGTSVTLTNANSVAHQFTFRSIFPTLSVPANTVNTFALVDSRDRYIGRSTSETSIRTLVAKFIDSVNSATGSLITALPTEKYNVVLLTQQIPGSAGNTTNTSTSPKAVVTNFTGGNSGVVRYPYGIRLSGSSGQGSEIIQRLVASTVSGTLDVPTSGRASLVNAYSDQHTYGAYQPYNEANAEQAFGVPEQTRDYGTKTRLYDDFFTRGSVSGSLDEPLWSKDKIVIDLTPVESTTIKSKNTVDDNYHMMYFNRVTKKWEKLGFGEYYLKNSPTLQQYLDRGYIGFGQFYNNTAFALSDLTYSYKFFNQTLASEYDKIAARGLKNNYRLFLETSFGSAIDTFGFPLHAKYHATASQAFPVEELIDRPFLVEKMVYEFSGSSEKGTLPGASFPDQFGLNKSYRAPTATFFILNQRKANPDPGQENSYTNVYVANREGGFNLANTYLPPIMDDSGGISPPRSRIERYENGGIPQHRVLSPGGPSVYVDSIRDLVTFARIGCVWPTYKQEIEDAIVPGSNHPAKVLDLAINVPASGTMNGVYTIASNIKSPTYNPSLNLHIINTGSTVGPSDIISLYAAKDTSTRNSLNLATGRSYRNEFNASSLDFSTTYSGGGTNIYTYSVSSDYADSPYLLLPGDKLIFGWQSQISNRTGESTSVDFEGYPLTISPGAGKLTLYGSYLCDDKPVHDIFKDQLNSDAAHETLPSGPWALDRFETEPQMCYTGSMREQYVAGTMLTKNGTSINVTDANDQEYNFTLIVPFAPPFPFVDTVRVNDFGVRRVLRNVSDGSSEPAIGVYPVQPISQRYSFNRNIRIIDQEEQYYDSMQPDPISILFKPSNVRAGIVPGAGGYVTLMLKGENSVYTPSAYAQTALNQYSNRKFIGSFPFESYYSGIERVKKVNSKSLKSRQVPSWSDTGSSISLGRGFIDYGPTYVTGTIGTGASSQKSNLARKGGVFFDERALVFNAWTFIPNVLPYGDTNPAKVPTVGYGLFRDEATDPNDDINYYASRFMGCFGNGYLGIIQNSSNITSFSPAPPYPFYELAYLMKYRGCKHGLVNPTPLFSNTIFNGTHYGQFRDMLEQRQYTRFSLSNNTLTDASVSVVFIDRSAPPGTYAITSGSATNSSNISKFATSEHPYDDSLADYGQIWDRTTALPETLIAL